MNQNTVHYLMGYLKTFLLLVIFAGIVTGCSRTIDRPNILWITIEDTSPQFMGFYGNEHVKTPNLDRLAREGVIFENAFASGPVCSASRSTLITGVNNLQLGSGNHRSQYPLPDYIKGFPAYLRSAGYFTTNNAKTDYNTANEKEMIRDSWDESSNSAGWWNRSDPKNFFSVFNYMNCHQSRTMTTPWKWYEMQVMSKLDKDQITSWEEIDVPPIYRDTPEMRKNLSRVYNSLNLVDIEIGKLIDSLRRDGLIESTIIFFFADHGEGIPRGKSSSIGFSYRVPFFIWFPEKFKHLSPWKTGMPANELICFEDLPPTVLSLAGIDIPGYMTGRAFLGKSRKKPKQYVFGSRNRIDESPDLVRTATDGQFFYTREFFQRYPSVLYQKYADVSDILRSIRKDFAEDKLNEEQSIMLERRDVEYLYDLKNDPWELNNLAKDPEFSDKLAKMRQACYERLIWNKDIHFLPEFEIAKISETTNPYEYRSNENLDMKAIIDAAYETTDPDTEPERLFELLHDENRFIRYWASVGIYQQLNNEQMQTEKLEIALKDTYDPVRIEIAAVLWEINKNEEAKELIKFYIRDHNVNNALQAMQKVVYMHDVTADIIETVALMQQKRNASEEGYSNLHQLSSVADMILYLKNNQPLFIPEFKQWTEAEYLIPGKDFFQSLKE